MMPALLMSLMIAGLPPQAVDIRVTPFPALGEDQVVGCTTIHTGMTLSGPDAFGGISSMEVRDNTLTLVTDNAKVFFLNIEQDDRGLITSVGSGTSIPITDETGTPLVGEASDSEGLVLEGETAIVSLERFHRVDLFSVMEDEWRTTETLLSRDDATLLNNSGFEALTRLADGRLMVISEGTDDNGWALAFISAHPSGRGPWTQHHYQSGSGTTVTDADVDPLTGDLFVLERGFAQMTGPRVRITRVAVGDVGTSDPMEGRQLGQYNFFHGIDNMEGLKVSRNSNGELILHMMSDDNFSDLQRTVLMGVVG